MYVARLPPPHRAAAFRTQALNDVDPVDPCSVFDAHCRVRVFVNLSL